MVEVMLFFFSLSGWLLFTSSSKFSLSLFQFSSEYCEYIFLSSMNCLVISTMCSFTGISFILRSLSLEIILMWLHRPYFTWRLRPISNAPWSIVLIVLIKAACGSRPSSYISLSCRMSILYFWRPLLLVCLRFRRSRGRTGWFCRSPTS